MTQGKSELSHGVYGKDIMADTFAKSEEKNNAEAAHMPGCEQLASAKVSRELRRNKM